MLIYSTSVLPFHSIAGWSEATKSSKVMGNKGWISEEKRAVKLQISTN